MMEEASGSCMHVNVHNTCSPRKYFSFALTGEDLYNRWITVEAGETEIECVRKIGNFTIKEYKAPISNFHRSTFSACS